MISGLHSSCFSFFLEKFSNFVINPKQVNTFQNDGVKINRKYGIRQNIIVTSEKDKPVKSWLLKIRNSNCLLKT